MGRRPELSDPALKGLFSCTWLGSDNPNEVFDKPNGVAPAENGLPPVPVDEILPKFIAGVVLKLNDGVPLNEIPVDPMLDVDEVVGVALGNAKPPVVPVVPDVLLAGLVVVKLELPPNMNGADVFDIPKVENPGA